MVFSSQCNHNLQTNGLSFLTTSPKPETDINDHSWKLWYSKYLKKKNNKITQEANCFQAGLAESVLMNKSRKNPG